MNELFARRTLFITGMTAGGKSDVAVAVAERLGGEIVSADAYQVYAEMPVLTAAPSPDQTVRVPHHVCGFLSVREEWDAVRHYHRAMTAIEDIHARGKIAVIAGGSGLYLKFLSHGLAESPPGDATLRKALEARPLTSLVEELTALDPEGASTMNLTNKRYVVRGLEIVLLSGKPLSSWRQNWLDGAVAPGFLVVRPLEEAERRIRERTRALLEHGAIDEVRALPEEMSSTAAKTIGVSSIRDYLEGRLSFEECFEQMALLTRRFAKRQRTWFRKESWLTPLDVTEAGSADRAAELIVSSFERA